MPRLIREVRADGPPRSISECIALAKKHEDETGEAPILDHDFAADVEEIVRNRGRRSTRGKPKRARRPQARRSV